MSGTQREVSGYGGYSLIDGGAWFVGKWEGPVWDEKGDVLLKIMEWNFGNRTAGDVFYFVSLLFYYSIVILRK